jgi:hypothetical protein
MYQKYVITCLPSLGHPEFAAIYVPCDPNGADTTQNLSHWHRSVAVFKKILGKNWRHSSFVSVQFIFSEQSFEL